MIFEILLNVITVVVTDLLSYVGAVPALPADVQSKVEGYFNLLTNAINCIGLFIDLKFVCLLLPLVIAIELFDKAYKIFMWSARKAPFLGIK